MSTNILGISAYYHDSAAALVRNGAIVAAAQEERFSRIKHDARFPAQAVAFCLRAAGISAAELDYLVFYEKPLQKFDRLLETYLAFAPRGFASFAAAMPQWLNHKLKLKRTLRRGLGKDYRGPLVFSAHHEAHAASAFFPSPFEEAAILTIDAVGEWSTASIGHGRGNRIRLIKELHFPHSLGLLYSAFTYYCGFKVNSGEYKLMGLAPYGEPCYRDLIMNELVRIQDDGSIWLDLSYFNYAVGFTMTSEKFHRRFGGPPRHPESMLTQRHMDIAASIQAVTEEVMLRMCRHAKELTGARKLCLAGGVALNCVGNGRILRSGLFEDIWIQAAAGDAGGALGAALFVWHQLLERPRQANPRDSQRGSLLGPVFSDEEISGYLRQERIPHHCYEADNDLPAAVSALLQQGLIVGWLQGPMEFGPRALGSRSILGDPRRSKMQATMNLKIKYRESFRPFAPAVLEEEAKTFFDIDCASPYMLLVAPVREHQRRSLSAAELEAGRDPDLRKRVNIVRSSIPAVTHVDYSARLQTVDSERHGRFYDLIKRFFADTGCPVLVNTSFNIRGEPIVCTPQEAYHCFMNTEMDALVLANCVILKREQGSAPGEGEKERYRSAFKPD